MAQESIQESKDDLTNDQHAGLSLPQVQLQHGLLSDTPELLQKHVDPSGTFDPEDPLIKRDIIAMILQYLRQNKYHHSSMTLQDESNVKVTYSEGRQTRVKRMKKAIKAGDWSDVEKLCTKHTLKGHKTMLYAVYKQQYLEMIDRHEFQKAYSFLNKRLKPFETLESSSKEFGDLCYLLTCKSVQEAPSFRDWQGSLASRTRLVELLERMADNSDEAPFSSALGNVAVPSNRLVVLLQQAAAYQIEFSRHQARTQPALQTLMQDYTCFSVPNDAKQRFLGHTDNVKCVEFVGEAGLLLATGSSDNTVRLWDTETAQCTSILRGHSSRIWDLSSTANGRYVLSASADSTCKMWDTEADGGLPDRSDDTDDTAETATAETQGPVPLLTLSGHKFDVYACDVNAAGTSIVTAGYDTKVRLFDVATGKLVRTLAGHTASVSCAVMSPLGNLIVTGSKDNSILFWDVVSGTCVKKFSRHLWEVTSVAMNRSGSMILSGSKDNSNRLWDMRGAVPVKRFKGHQNTTRNFVRCAFGPREDTIVGGSEDGRVHVWDATTEDVIHRLEGHNGVVYGATWNDQKSLLATCSHDGTAATWGYSPSRNNVE